MLVIVHRQWCPALQNVLSKYSLDANPVGIRNNRYGKWIAFVRNAYFQQLWIGISRVSGMIDNEPSLHALYHMFLFFNFIVFGQICKTGGPKQ